MPLTASFTEARANFTQLTDMVMRERVPVTVFKRNKPAFRIVPIEDAQDAYAAAASGLADEYADVFEALACEREGL